MIWSDQQLADAMETAELWRGTQHRNRIASLGRGIDCIRFVIEVLKGAGLVDDQPLPAYPIAWGIGHQENKIAAALAASMDVERIKPADWTPHEGDITIWRVGRQSNHCGIILGGEIWHVACGVPCGPTSIERTRYDLQEIVRLRRPGWTVPPGSVKLREI